ncbi:hypothetical protein [Terribacillus saccharophilus]|uniref:hypothetical protein n=1 Tax=Terribacillus saccharophilus TaxID=361277 RepID=UPI003D2B0532
MNKQYSLSHDAIWDTFEELSIGTESERSTYTNLNTSYSSDAIGKDKDSAFTTISFSYDMVKISE